MPRYTTRERRRILAEHGPGCFADPYGPKAKRAGRPRYPLCNLKGRRTCQKVKKAYMRAAQQHEAALRDRLRETGRRMGCPWAMG